MATRQLINQQGSGLNAPPRASQGLVGRVTYNLSKKYFVEFNAAYNGSEQFAKGKQYGFFPAVSAGWTLSNEKFMQPVAAIDFLRLRASFGTTGNSRIGSYASRGLYDLNNVTYGGQMSATPSSSAAECQLVLSLVNRL